MRLFFRSEDGDQHHDNGKPEQRTAESDQHFGDAGDRPVLPNPRINFGLNQLIEPLQHAGSQRLHVAAGVNEMTGD